MPRCSPQRTARHWTGLTAHGQLWVAYDPARGKAVPVVSRSVESVVSAETTRRERHPGEFRYSDHAAIAFSAVDARATCACR